MDVPLTVAGPVRECAGGGGAPPPAAPARFDNLILQVCETLGIAPRSDISLDLNDEAARQWIAEFEGALRLLDHVQRAELILHMIGPYLKRRQAARQTARHREDVSTRGRKPRTDELAVDDLRRALKSGGFDPDLIIKSDHGLRAARVINGYPSDIKQRARNASSFSAAAQLQSGTQRKATVPVGRPSAPRRRSVTSAASALEDLQTSPEALRAAEARRTRALNAERQYVSMINAVPDDLNLPMLRIAEKIETLLGELHVLNPEVAATQMPARRWMTFSLEGADWWLRFVTACESHREEKTDFPRRQIVQGMASNRASLFQASMLNWLKAQQQSVTAIEAAVATGTTVDTARHTLDLLVTTRRATVDKAMYSAVDTAESESQETTVAGRAARSGTATVVGLCR